MTAAPEIVAENAAWERYRHYVVSNMPRHNGEYGHGIFLGDETSHSLWCDWIEVRALRDHLRFEARVSRRHRQYRWPT